MMYWIFLIATIIKIVSACPTSCICKWKGGKQTVECVNKSLITVVEGMDPNTQVLDYTGNNLKTLHNEKFQKMGLVNLQKIYLSRCRISVIDSKAFRGLTNLVDLDFSHNVLQTVPSDTFPDYPSLMKLTLSGNPIKQIKTGAFQPLSYLVTLELSKCGIEVIEDAAFVGLDSLEWLKLDNNKITTISGSNILPTGLHGIDLHHNPWTCDCLLIGLRRWLESTKTPMAIDPICSVPPRLSSVTIKQLSIDELACEPQITPSTFYLEIQEGKNVSLLCKVSAIPEAKITWLFDGVPIQNESMSASESHAVYSTEEGTEIKKSELLIYNSNIDDNGTFVCVAENQAGSTSSNYTIRIVLKEENVEVVTVFPLEYVLIVSGIISVCSLVLIFLLVLCFLCFRRKKKKLKKKDESDKNVNGSNENVVKNLRESPKYTSVNATSATCMDKVNGGYIIADGHNDMMLYATDSGILVATNNMNTYPSYSISYQIEQNPDLVNDAESVDKDRRAQGGEDTQDTQDKASEAASVQYSDSGSQCQEWGNVCYNRMQPMQHIVLNNVYNQPADIHLTPEKFMDRDGYPVDFGLPKVPTHFPALVPATAYYRTLPHRRHTAANPNNRYSREAEFLSRSSQPASYEHYAPADVRYNIEGYPSASPTPYSSAPRVSFTEPLHILQGQPMQSNPPTETTTKNEQTWTESSADEQPSTSNPEKSNENKSEGFQAKRHMIDSLLKNRDVKVGSHLHPHRGLMLPPVLTESPDEGYEGEGPETTEM
ncbi:hypothetical protein M8J76_003513 [Diaphorina citri]|nr:hypothetical protein M8J76_003513 [Diaphorina citri]